MTLLMVTIAWCVDLGPRRLMFVDPEVKVTLL